MAGIADSVETRAPGVEPEATSRGTRWRRHVRAGLDDAAPTTPDDPRQHRVMSRHARFAKRAADLVLGLVLLLIALPVIAVFALISAVVLHAWPFFVQDRVGRNGRIFRFPKIRTLPKTAAAVADKREIMRMPLPRWSQFLRGAHLDELPQLLCVVTGRMSLVGPRPEMPKILERYPPAFVATRSLIRPGCTGLWQISVANGGMIYEAPQYDELYIRRVSLPLDVWILWRTVLSSASSRYRTTLVDMPRRLARLDRTNEPAHTVA